MKKGKTKIIVVMVVSLVMILNIASQSYAQAVASVAGMSYASSVWNSSRELLMPVLFRAGSYAKYGVGKFGPLAVASMVGGIMYEAYQADPTAFPAIGYWMASVGISASGGKYYSNVSRVAPKVGSGLAQCANALASSCGTGSSPIAELYTGSAADSVQLQGDIGFLTSPMGNIICARSNITSCYQNCYGYTGNELTLNLGSYKQVYNGAPSVATCSYAGHGVVNFYWVIAGALPQGQYDVLGGVEMSVEGVRTRLYNALASGTGTALTNARNAVKEAMEWLNKQYRSASTALNKKANAGGTTVGENTNNLSRTAVGSTFTTGLENDANAETQGADVTESVVDSANAENAADEEAGEDGDGDGGDPPEMPELPQSSPTENEDVMGEAGNEDQVTAEKGKMSTILAPLKAIYQSLQSSVISAINGIIPSGGGGLCSLSAGVYGGNANLDFCSIDYSGLRSLVIMVSALLALLIILS